MKKLPTIAMPPMPEYYYDPIPLILSGEKVHTLRKRRCHGQNEVCVKSKRTGIVLEFGEHIQMLRYEFLRFEFARADGFMGSSPSLDLALLLKHFYDEVPETMWCNYFRVVQRPEEEQKCPDEI